MCGEQHSWQNALHMRSRELWIRELGIAGREAEDSAVMGLDDTEPAGFCPCGPLA